MKDKLKLSNLNKFELNDKELQSVLGGDTNCACWCSAGTSKGWRAQYESENGHPPPKR